MSDATGHPAPDELAFYEAWLGRRWSRCRRWFEAGVTPRDFDWRSAAYPLAMGNVGVYRPLAGLLVVAVVLAGWLFAGAPGMAAGVVVFAGAALLVLWPAAVVVAVVALVAGSIEDALVWWPPALVAVSVAVGFLAPRWIVAEGRRRWARHAGRIAAGEAPPPPGPYALPTWVGPTVGLAGLALIAWMVLYPHRHDYERMYRSAMRSDLRNLVTAQEAYFVEYLRYTRELPPALFTAQPGLTVEVVQAGDSGWAAVAREHRTATVCAIFVGNAAPPIPGATEGEPTCTAP